MDEGRAFIEYNANDWSRALTTVFHGVKYQWYFTKSRYGGGYYDRTM